MITVTAYQPSYFDHLVMLHETQGSHISHNLEPSWLPEIGYVATEGSIIVAIGFLRRVEGGYAQIDTLVTNADLEPLMRHEGISAVVDELILKARVLELKGIICHTSDEGILKRARAIGFKSIPQTIIGLTLVPDRV